MITTSSRTLLALAVSTVLTGPALAQAQDNPCRELINVLQGGQSATDAPITLDQARRYRENNNLQACRQALADLARRAHARAGVSANVTARDFRSGASTQPGSPTGQQQTRAPEQYRQEQGRVVSVRPVRVRGVTTPNYIVVIETQPGRRIVADIGQDRRGQDLRQGTPVAVRGQVVRVGDRGALLLADAIRINDQTYDVTRPAFRRMDMSGAAAGSMGRQQFGQGGFGAQQLAQGTGGSRFQERAALRRQLRQAGFQNIRILDAAYLVRAQTPDGRAVMMMVDPPRAALLGVGSPAGRQNQPSGFNRDQSGVSRQGQQLGANRNVGPGADQDRPTGATRVAVESRQPYGQYLVDANGRALYILEKDPRGESTCYDACAEAWPPLTASGAPVAGGELVPSYLGTITRRDGTTQVTYNGMPLYYYAKDQGPGTVTGQDVHDQWGEWYLVAPEGTAITATRSG